MDALHSASRHCLQAVDALGWLTVWRVWPAHFTLECRVSQSHSSASQVGRIHGTDKQSASRRGLLSPALIAVRAGVEALMDYGNTHRSHFQLSFWWREKSIRDSVARPLQNRHHLKFLQATFLSAQDLQIGIADASKGHLEVGPVGLGS